MRARLAVLGYGSLVDRASAAATLGRPVDEVLPVSLPGWRRRFSVARDNRTSEKSFARAGDRWVPPTVLLLNLEPCPDDAEGPNAALVPVELEELARLDARELRYDRVDVTGAVGAQAPGVELVVTYVASPRHLATEPPPGAVVLRSYVGAVEAAFTALGPGQLEAYRRTTGPPPVPTMEGVPLPAGAPRAGNPTRW